MYTSDTSSVFESLSEALPRKKKAWTDIPQDVEDCGHCRRVVKLLLIVPSVSPSCSEDELSFEEKYGGANVTRLSKS